MKVSEQWLQEWVRPNLSVQALADVLTMGGLEVDQIHPVAADFSGVVVAHVLTTEPHPEADRLTLCQVDAGEDERLSIVCGAKNVRPGLRVALAKVGAKLPNGMEIKATKLRGQLSQGMLCSTEELGMSDEAEGIMELEADAPIGMNLRTYLHLDDHILEIDLTPNRGDCLSMEGIAREVAAKLNLPFSIREKPTVLAATAQTIQVEVDAPEACPLYIGRMITNIQVDAKTPLWMKEKLQRAGIRPIHPVVDVTQYVMLELGQPLHAFDATKINEKIKIRFAHAAESFTLLDGRRVSLLPQTLVIADHQSPLALAGIMGGAESAVSPTTTEIFLESAFFAPRFMVGTARQYGLATEASHRYERGVDPNLAERALERATALIQDITGGVAGPLTKVKQDSQAFESKQIDFQPENVKKLIGIELSETEILSILQALGFTVETSALTKWQVSVPTHRFDVFIEEDLIEEIVRIHGYNQLPAEQTVAALQCGHRHCIESNDIQVARTLSALGYHQCITYSFVDPALQSLLFPDQASVVLANPLSTELSHMRVSLWPGLIASMLYNLNRQQDRIALFETGSIYSLDHAERHQEDPLSSIEIPTLGALLTGTTAALEWGLPTRTYDFYDLKGHIEFFFKQFSVQGVRFEQAEHPSLHPGQSARLVMGDETIGWYGALHPKILQLLDVSNDVFLFEVDQRLLSASNKQYQSVSKYPRIRRDLALLADQKVTFSAIEDIVKSVDDQHILKSVHVFDIYTGPPIPADKKSLALALFMQSNDKTLNDMEINRYISAIIDKLDNKLSITLRDGSS